ncbi:MULTISPECIES: GNAT family N-acetyltransferase [Clostridia]|uniref:GNAT family N-acetyltransferase n=1 Tax=Clostridia TaxID=186801 RepID=UPI000E9FFFB2|nr:MULTISPECIES: GNAT family N-acetyltransferase [Clostridia]NBJ68282.1 GNAT family N-acetyltransferase [Roseburia sp. 1XD42-34]RKI82044.1 GNAT family N-acetyltransferase [Clostridium sp. 1xD42-85]
MTTYLKPTPWDERNFQMNTFELTSSSEVALRQTDNIRGHFTLKIDPTQNTELLYKYGFYYTDTLMKPFCRKDQLVLAQDEAISLSDDYDIAQITHIAGNAFRHSRFHRDFNVPDWMVNKRFQNWVLDLAKVNNMITLYYENQLAGFFAFDQNNVTLLAIDTPYQGRGLAKPFTSHCVKYLFSLGDYEHVTTSVSAANFPSLNVFISIGFRIDGAVDVYHKCNVTPLSTGDW